MVNGPPSLFVNLWLQKSATIRTVSHTLKMSYINANKYKIYV